MAEVEVDVETTGVPKKRTFKKFLFSEVYLDDLLDMFTDDLVNLFTARARRRFQRGLKRKPMALIKKLRKVYNSSTTVVWSRWLLWNQYSKSKHDCKLWSKLGLAGLGAYQNNNSPQEGRSSAGTSTAS